MNSGSARDMITRSRQPDHCFIKWWGEDEALVDFELLDRFLEKGDKVGAVVGFQLLSLEEMWRLLVDLDPNPLSREREGERDVIRWQWEDPQGKEQVTIFPYTPEGLMELMDRVFVD